VIRSRRADPARQHEERPRRAARAALVASLGAVLLALVASPAAAHLGRISYSELHTDGNQVLYRLKFAAHLAPGLPEKPTGPITRDQIQGARDAIQAWFEDSVLLKADSVPCTPDVQNLLGPDRNDDLQVLALYTCPVDPERELRLDFRAFDALAIEDYENIVSLRVGGKSWSYVFGPGNHLMIVPLAGARAGSTPKKHEVPAAGGKSTEGGSSATGGSGAASSAAGPAADAGSGESVRQATAAGDEASTDELQQPSRFRVFFELGVWHILEGWDHLLFLIALLLFGGGLVRVAGIVSAFTVAHSITLALAVLGWIELPPRPVEAMIAASILYVACENIWAEKADHRPLVTFGFGLFHGLGFAGVLKEAGLAPGEVAVPLVAFNIGVEAGQLLVVCAVVPALAVAMRGRAEKPLRVGLSALVGLAALYWLAVRLAGL
jgi:hypothetical protein